MGIESASTNGLIVPHLSLPPESHFVLLKGHSLQTRYRIFAAAGAVVATGFAVVIATRGSNDLIAWLDGLSSRELLVLRTLCLVVPLVLVPLGVVLRRS